MKIKLYLDCEEILSKNINKIYGLIIRQCTVALIFVLRSDKGYKEKLKLFDALWLLGKVKSVTSGVDLKENPVLSIHEQMISCLP